MRAHYSANAYYDIEHSVLKPSPVPPLPCRTLEKGTMTTYVKSLEFNSVSVSRMAFELPGCETFALTFRQPR